MHPSFPNLFVTIFIKKISIFLKIFNIIQTDKIDKKKLFKFDTLYLLNHTHPLPLFIFINNVGTLSMKTIKMFGIETFCTWVFCNLSRGSFFFSLNFVHVQLLADQNLEAYFPTTVSKILVAHLFKRTARVKDP